MICALQNKEFRIHKPVFKARLENVANQRNYLGVLSVLLPLIKSALETLLASAQNK